MGTVGQGGACRRARPSPDLGHLGRSGVLEGKSPQAGLSRWPRGLLKSSFVLRGAGPGRGGGSRGQATVGPLSLTLEEISLPRPGREEQLKQREAACL